MINDFVCTVIREEKNNLLNVINKSVTIRLASDVTF